MIEVAESDEIQKVLPCEKLAMSHFAAHYAAFVDVMKHNINEPFTPDQLIALHHTYATRWGIW